ADPVRARILLHQLAAALRAAEAPGVGFGLRRTAVRGLPEHRRTWRSPLTLNATELSVLIAWPIGLTAGLPIVRQTSRQLPPAAAIRRSGRVIGEATFPGEERPVALDIQSARRHLHVLGPTGVGKSTLLLNLVCADMA